MDALVLGVGVLLDNPAGRSPDTGRTPRFAASSQVTPLPKEASMEGIEKERWARLLDAIRNVDGGSGPDGQTVRIQIRHARTGFRSGTAWLAVRALGALAVLAVGAVHLQQYLWLYSNIPTIGTLFVLNFAGATAIGLGLLAPVERVLGARWGGAALGLLVLGGIGLAATAFVFLAISEQTLLFGFMEPGYDPTAILASRITEVAAVVSLSAFGIARFVAHAAARW